LPVRSDVDLVELELSVTLGAPDIFATGHCARATLASESPGIVKAELEVAFRTPHGL